MLRSNYKFEASELPQVSDKFTLLIKTTQITHATLYCTCSSNKLVDFYRLRILNSKRLEKNVDKKFRRPTMYIPIKYDQAL